MRMRLHALLLGLLALALLLLALLLAAPYAYVNASAAAATDPAAYPYLRFSTFASIKDVPLERMALFFTHSSDNADNDNNVATATLLHTLNRVAKRIRRSVPHFVFDVCDGAREENRAEFAAAGFRADSTYIFTSTPVEGIVKYTGPVTYVDLVNHVLFKYAPSDASLVHNFTTLAAFERDLSSSSPRASVFVKFFENWCEHCRRLAPVFVTSATFFHVEHDELQQELRDDDDGDDDNVRRRVPIRHVQVECGRDDLTRSFCARHDVTSYPTLKLFLPDGRIVPYTDEMRSVGAFERFFEQHVRGFQRLELEWWGKKAKAATAAATKTTTTTTTTTSESPVQKQQKQQQRDAGEPSVPPHSPRTASTPSASAAAKPVGRFSRPRAIAADEPASTASISSASSAAALDAALAKLSDLERRLEQALDRLERVTQRCSSSC